MKHTASKKFWDCFYALPNRVQPVARANFELLKQNPSHRSLQFKPVRNGDFYSVRVTLGYRALGIPVSGGVHWFWIGNHSAYDKLIS